MCHGTSVPQTFHIMPNMLLFLEGGGVFYLHYPFPLISSHYYPFHFPYLLYHFPCPRLLPRPSLPLPRNLPTHLTDALTYRYCDHWPLQLAVFLSWSSTSANLLKPSTRMTFLGALATSLSSASFIALVMPSATSFVRTPPSAMSFSLSASSCIYDLRDIRYVRKLSQNVCNISSRINYSVCFTLVNRPL